MSRHVDPDDHSFRRSLLRAAAGGLAALVVTAGVTAVLMRLARDDGTGGPAVVFTEPATLAPTTIEAPTSDPEATTAAPTPTETTTPVEMTEDPDGTVTVQVLYSGPSSAAAEDAAAVLRDLGYDVVAVNGTRHTVDETTVFASPGWDDAAEELRETDPRFAAVDANTVFVEDVNLHVIVGPEWPAG